MEVIVPASGNTFGLTIDNANSKVYFSRDNSIKRVNFDGSNLETLTINFTDSFNFPSTLAVDSTNNIIYFVDQQVSSNPDRFIQSSLSSNTTTVLGSPIITSPGGVAIDPITKHKYWIDNRKIQRTSSTGSSVQTLINSRAVQVIDLHYESTSKKLYWLDYGLRRVQRSNPDGSSVEDILTGIGTANSMAIDYDSQSIYWADFNQFQINRSSLNGTQRSTLITRSDPIWHMHIAPNSNKIYWLEGFGFSRSVFRSNLDGSNIESLGSSSLFFQFKVDEINSKLIFITFNVDHYSIARSNFNGSNLEILIDSNVEANARLFLDNETNKIY